MVSLISKKYQKDIAFLMLMVLSLNFTAPLYGSGVTGMFDFPEGTVNEDKNLLPAIYVGGGAAYSNMDDYSDELVAEPEHFSSKEHAVEEEGVAEDDRVEDFDTDGPGQPEMRGFTPVGASDMVDLFTGDFSYNIPLLDVGGYPVNISYSGNVSMEQESSWVGLGWNINPGSISRSSRGLPDDFNGEDKIVTTNRMKPHTVIGGSLGAGLELIGKDLPLELGVDVGGYYNSRSGWGTQVGVNATANISNMIPSSSTDDPNNTRIGFGLNFDSQEGVGVSLTASHMRQSMKTGMSGQGSISTNYNSRQGFKDLNIGFSTNKMISKGRSLSIGSGFFMNSPVPAVNSPFSTVNVKFELKPGYEMTVLHANTKLGGYYVRSRVSEKDETILKSAYGYLHYERSKSDENALLDFNRQKEGIYRVRPLTQNIGIPVYTYDMFSVSGEGVSGMYRAYRSDIGNMRDPVLRSTNNSIGGGIDLGFGVPPPSIKVGGNLSLVHSRTESGSWNLLNNAISKVPFSNKWGYQEPSYFKNAGDMTVSKQRLYDKFGEEQLVKFSMNDVNAGGIALNPVFSLQSKLDSYSDNISKTGSININSRVDALGVREVRNQLFSHYTADEAIELGEGTIQSYAPNYFYTNKLPFLVGNNGVVRIPRKDPDVRKGHHISMVSVLSEDGRRYEYNIPVYNLDNREVSYSVRRHHILDEEKNETFSIAKKEVIANTGNKLTGYRINDAESDLATDKYYSRQITPAYSHSFLLTGIFSPDYVDVTGNGPSEDDLGDGISFKYSQVYGSWNPYKWRIPFNKDSVSRRPYLKYENNQWVSGYTTHDSLSGNYEEGLKTDFRDDKASYVYGEKEVWYLNRIESKTMVATFIISKNRQDAASQMSEVGGRDEAKQLYRLDEIRLYAKSDFARNGLNAKPIKTVHFEYDHTLCAGYPLNANADSGKLTLKKIWFSYNGNKKGRVNAYKFHYRNNQRFAYQASDNWGNYKDKQDNPVGPDNKVLTNRDYPYPVSNGALAGKSGNVAPWALDSIVLPSGSNIKVTYESDDYGYVQNRRAMQLFQLYGVGNTKELSSAGNKLYSGRENHQTNRYVFIKLPKPFKSKGEIEALYLKDIRKLYFKLNVKMPLDPAFDIYNKRYEYVKLYSDIKDFGIADIGNNIIWIELRSSSKKNDDEDGYSPLVKAAIQFLRTTLPAKGYPGSAFPADVNLNIGSFAKAFVRSFGSIMEITQNFHTQKLKEGTCQEIDLKSSFVRLTEPFQKKIGGGYRVKRVVINDNWNKMTGQKQSSYGQEYLYTKESDNGYSKSTVSSGVATFEPFLGGEENPFRYPLETYNEKSGLLGPQDLFYTEGPMLESFYPGASVGYSVVRVKSIHSEGVKSKTGLSENRFYTAYDYPVKEYYTPMGDGFTNFRTPPGIALKNPLKYISITRIAFSQGFKVELNDMHGKIHSQSSYSESNLKEPLSRTIYHYKHKEINGENRQLVNDVSVIDKSGSVTSASMGRDIEVMTDFREHESKTFSGGVDLNFHVMFFGFIPAKAFRAMPSGGSFAYSTTQTASLVKVINKRAVVEKVEVYDKGSTVATENVAYDSETGQVLVTKTKNEYGDSLYTVNIPAHWRYDRMGQAYKNIGVEVSDRITNGRLQNSFNEQYFVPGDEVLCTIYGPVPPVSSPLPVGKASIKLWVARSSEAVSDASYKDPVKEMPGFGSSYSGINFVMRGGQLFNTEGRIATLKVIRSGRKNQAGASVGSITLKGNPIVDNRLKIDWTNNVLNASSMEFKEDWANKARFWQLDSCRVACECPVGYTLDIATRNCIIAGDSLPTVLPDSVPLFGHFPFHEYGTDKLIVYKPGKFNINGTDLAGGHSLDVSIVSSSAYWINTTGTGGAFNRGAVWLKNEDNTPFSRKNPNGSDYFYPVDTAIGFVKTIEVPVSKYYYFGLGADNVSVVKIDCQTVFDNSSLYVGGSPDGTHYKSWNVYPIYLTAGLHTVEMSGKNMPSSNTNPAAFAVEIYNNTESEILSATSDTDLNILYSSREMIDKPVQVGEQYGIVCASGCLRESNGRVYCAENTVISASCIDQDPVGVGTENTNPYVQGLLGNYRAWRSYAYYDARKEPTVNDTTNIRTYGLINNFTPFWTYNTSGNWLSDNKGSKWVWTSENTLYDRKGNGIESRDPLGRYTSGQFGYNQTVPIAVSQNSKYRESGFDGFEDYDYKLDSYIGIDSCEKIILKHFDWTKYKHLRSADFSHTGLYSLRIPQSEEAFVNFKVSDTSEDNKAMWIRDNRVLSGGNSYPRGLITNENSWLPVYSPTYKDSIVVSAWVREQNLCKTGGYEQAGIVISFQNASFATVGAPVPLKASGPVIEGWQRIEGIVMVPAGSTGVSSMRVSLEGGSSQSVYYDDLRIHPFKANMKSFVYHPVNLRLLSELDENNYASFYEYDDEGTLIRVKKETERGVKTIKETRSALIKQED